ncbi:hypothetical protein [Candidatus Amarolinea dominans]|uniref:hypothetical protein n=1 Tax=Candidatus Amarolinea dominans TaxID=3140696 RepID=UPI001D63699B|nr:hypothetical protein [Anaerolineae bacterium]
MRLTWKETRYGIRYAKNYRNLVIYEVYVRNHGPNGAFADVEADLLLASMGVDVVWFMPIHPIGQLNKKGHPGLSILYSGLSCSQPRIWY